MRTTKNVQIPGSLPGRFKGESKGYRPGILSYNAKTIQLTKFRAFFGEEGDENEKRFLSSFNSSEAQASTSPCSPLGHFPLLCGKRCRLMVTEERMITHTDNSQQFSRPAAESKA